MTHTKDEALKLALDALENHEGNYKLNAAGCDRHDKAITAIKQALAAPVQFSIEMVPDPAATVYPELYRANWEAMHGKSTAQPAAPVLFGSIQHLKTMMEESAWEGRLELSDAMANIDEFYTKYSITEKGQPLIDLRQDAWNKINSPEQVAALDKTIVDFASGTKGQL